MNSNWACCREGRSRSTSSMISPLVAAFIRRMGKGGRQTAVSYSSAARLQMIMCFFSLWTTKECLERRPGGRRLWCRHWPRKDGFKKTFTTESKHYYFEKTPAEGLLMLSCLFAVYTPRQLGGENDFLIHASKRALNVFEDFSFHRARC